MTSALITIANESIRIHQSDPIEHNQGLLSDIATRAHRISVTSATDCKRSYGFCIIFVKLKSWAPPEAVRQSLRYAYKKNTNPDTQLDRDTPSDALFRYSSYIFLCVCVFFILHYCFIGVLWVCASGPYYSEFKAVFLLLPTISLNEPKKSKEKKKRRSAPSARLKFFSLLVKTPYTRYTYNTRWIVHRGRCIGQCRTIRRHIISRC